MKQVIIELDYKIYYKGYDVNADHDPIRITTDPNEAYAFNSVHKAKTFNIEIARHYFEFSRIVEIK